MIHSIYLFPETMKTATVLRFTITIILNVSLSYGTERKGCRKVDFDHHRYEECPDGYEWTCRKSNMEEIPEFPEYNNSSRLCMIDLSKNWLQTIYNHSFINVTDVMWLWLHENKIVMIHSDSFVGLGNLIHLDLRGNPLYYPSSFCVGVFRPLFSLKKLNLKSNLLNQSYDGIVDQLQPLKNLNELNISGCYGCTFETGFENLTNLHNLSLNSGNKEVCNISVLLNSTFIHFPQVRRLCMSDCAIQEVEVEALTPLKDLNYLDIGYNTDLKFSGLRNVLKSLKHSRIEVLYATHIYPKFERGTALEKDFMAPVNGLKHLTHLYMDLNKIEVIDKEVFKMIPESVYVFTLAGNRLSYGEYVNYIKDMEHVSYLDLSRQHLQYDPFHSSHQDSVPKLDAQNKYTTDYKEIETEHIPAPKTPINLEMVRKRLFGKETLLQTIPSSSVSENIHYQTVSNCSSCIVQCLLKKEHCICPPPNLKTLLWKKSVLNFKLLSFTVCGLSRLETLDMSFNLIYQWIGPIYGLEGLKDLSLASNFCENMTSSFLDNMPNLEKLDLSNNFLGQSLHPTKISGPTHFKNLKYLEKLDLSENRITALSSNIFQNLERLQYLDLSENMISEWNITLPTRNLKLLDLSNNKLDSLPTSVRESLDELANSVGSSNRTDNVIVDLSGNPIQCKCDDRPFLKWRVDSPVIIKFNETDECRLQNGSRVSLNDFDGLRNLIRQLDVDCVPYVFIAISICIFLVSISTCFVVYRFRWKLRHIYYKRLRRHNYKGYERLFERDAFISYSQSEGSFIKNKLVPALEAEMHNIKLWVADRDSHAGASVAENITHAIYSSKKTVLILSKNYFKADWCSYEMNMARVESVESKRKLLIIILYEDMSPKEIPLDYLRLLRSERSLEYPTHPQDLDTFWTSLIQAIQEE